MKATSGKAGADPQVDYSRLAIVLCLQQDLPFLRMFCWVNLVPPICRHCEPSLRARIRVRPLWAILLVADQSKNLMYGVLNYFVQVGLQLEILSQPPRVLTL